MLAGGSERRGGQLGESVANQATRLDGGSSQLMRPIRMSGTRIAGARCAC